MSKNLIIAVGILLFIIVGTGGYLVMNANKKVPAEVTTSPTTAQNDSVTSLKSLLTTKNNQQCTFADTEAKVQGTMYIGEGKAKGDFSSEYENKQVTSHLLTTGQEVYIWMDNSTTGFKASLDALETVQEKVPQTIDINKETSYTCTPWSPTASTFAVPTNITFTDYSSLMRDMGSITSTPLDTKAACEACNNLTGSAQTQCKAALKCN